jgi:hypothetical protein
MRHQGLLNKRCARTDITVQVVRVIPACAVGLRENIFLAHGY